MGYCTWSDMNEANKIYHDTEWGILENLMPESCGSWWSKYIGNCDVYRTEADADCTMDSLKADNRNIIDGFRNAGEQVLLIESDYEKSINVLLD